MIRYFLLTFFVAAACVIGLAGFRGTKMAHPPIEIFPDMDHQPKFQPQHPSSFFADGSSARKPVPGTIPMGYVLPGSYYQVSASNRTDTGAFSNQPDYYNTGEMEGVYGDGLPPELKLDAKLMARGRERYNINCKICHGGTGLGDGVIKQYGLAIVSLQEVTATDPKVMPDGRLFSIITHGKNLMGAYGPVIAVEDRWAIVAYVRALQRARKGTVADLTAEQQQQLKSLK